jgi:hypothetical protein
MEKACAGVRPPDVRKGISVMLQFRKTEISDAELGALAAMSRRRPREALINSVARA